MKTTIYLAINNLNEGFICGAINKKRINIPEPETACKIPCVNNCAYFGDLYMGEIIAEEYNPYLKRNILTLKTTAGTITKIRDPRGEVTKWNLKP